MTYVPDLDAILCRAVNPSLTCTFKAWLKRLCRRLVQLGMLEAKPYAGDPF